MGRRDASIVFVSAVDDVGLMSNIWLGRDRGGEVTGVVKGDLLWLCVPPAVPGLVFCPDEKFGWRTEGFIDCDGPAALLCDAGREADCPDIPAGPECWANSGCDPGIDGCDG